jgi:WD40 repeat protein
MPYSKYASSDPIYATAVYPHFSLGSPTTTLVLYAARETPIQLRNALDYAQGIYATYRWFDPNTEEVVTPHSLVFNADATHFVAGSRAKFAIFDVNRPNAKAATIRATSKSRHAVKIYGEDSHKFSTLPHSCITTMDISSEDVLAFGTTTRHVALYADHGQGDLISSFRLPVASSNGPFSGKGITQVKWSPDGTYLFIAERQSDIIEVYDIRHNHQRLSWLSGRQANVNFKLGFDVVPTLHGLEVWGGGADGYVRMWSSPEQQEGEIRWAGQWPVHDGMTVIKSDFSG